MGSGIYHNLIPGLEVSQENIDYWCDRCQFPIESPKCQSKEMIRQCWNRAGSIAHVWHLLHECPFAHVGQECHCNDFKTRQEAFASVGLVYREANLT